MSTKRDPVVVVDVGEPGDVAVGQLRHRREEPVVLRLVGDPLVELDQQLGVLGPDRPDVRGPAVAQHDVGLPVARRLDRPAWPCSPGPGRSPVHRIRRPRPGRRWSSGSGPACQVPARLPDRCSPSRTAFGVRCAAPAASLTAGLYRSGDPAHNGGLRRAAALRGAPHEHQRVPPAPVLAGRDLAPH